MLSHLLCWLVGHDCRRMVLACPGLATECWWCVRCELLLGPTGRPMNTAPAAPPARADLPHG